MTPAHNTPETLETELNRLVLLLEAVESAWVYAVYDDVPTRDQLIATMRERLAPIAVLERSLAGSGETSPLEFAQQTPVLPNQSAPVICFTGLGNAIMQGHLPNLLDMHREALASTRHRLVFWVRENEWVELLETARNFSSRIGGSFDFQAEIGKGLGSEPRTQIEVPRLAVERLSDKSFKESRFKQIKEQIRVLDEDDQKNAQELAVLYSDLGNLYDDFDSPRWLEAESAHLKAARFFPNTESKARELLQAGYAAYRSDMSSLAIQNYQKALNLYNEVGDLFGQADASIGIGNAKILQGKLSEAYKYFAKALKFYNELDNSFGRAETIITIGHLQLLQGDFEYASANFNLATVLYNNLNNDSGKLRTILGFGFLKQLTGELEDALKYFDKAIDLNIELVNSHNLFDYRLDKANAIKGIGDVSLFQGDYTKAIKNYDKSLSLYNKFNDRYGQAGVIVGIGDVKRLQGELGEALENYNKALSLFDELNDGLGQGITSSGLSQIMVLQGHISKAEPLLKAALEIFQKCGYRYNYAEATGNYGLALKRAGKPLDARPYLEQAIELFEALEVPKIAQRYRDALK